MNTNEKATLFMRTLGRQAWYDAINTIEESINTMVELGPEMGYELTEVEAEVDSVVKDAFSGAWDNRLAEIAAKQKQQAS